MSEANRVSDSERGVADDLKRTLRAVEARIRRLKHADQTKPEGAIKCAKLADQLEAMREEVSVARAAACTHHRQPELAGSRKDRYAPVAAARVAT